MSLSGVFPIEKSDFYQFYLIERREIDKLKWEMEIDEDRARWIWSISKRHFWISGLRSSGLL